MSEDQHQDRNKLNEEESPYNPFDETREDPTKIDIDIENLKNAPKSFFNFVKERLSIKDEVDEINTVDAINDEVQFKGHNVWVLVFSIFIASIGLNMNSVAVVIGAMLISPLMGPIKGIGLAVAIYDFRLLVKSMKNFGVMVGISLLSSLIFFLLSPFNEASEEILARTQPSFFDVLIATFGGFAGIIAATQKKGSFTVISGVAIATALMPPLCVTGFMLAHGEYQLMFDSFYLFVINSIFICLSTLVVVRLLNFEKVEYVNAKTENRVKIYIGIFLLVVLVPSVFKFYNEVQENIYMSNAKSFVQQEIDGYEIDGFGELRYEVKYLYTGEPSKNQIEIVVKNHASIPTEIEDEWKRKLGNYNIAKTKLVILDAEDEEEVGLMTYEEHFKLEQKLRKIIQQKDEQLMQKQTQIDLYKSQSNAFTEVNTQALNQFNAEAKYHFKDLDKVSYGMDLIPSVRGVDTLRSFTLYWNIDLEDSTKISRRIEFNDWMKTRLNGKKFKSVNGEEQ